jgi:hypothetical protein
MVGADPVKASWSNTIDSNGPAFITMAKLTAELRAHGWRFLLVSPDDMDRRAHDMAS